ncbi:Enterochelin esterase [Flaviramulus basaltis]|uniref:Enterochelin esterase n=1 Tax=Flaviramulus basaltis TaxID=369401 RepID=A0A1K2IF13_9FLAO|nr:alpha/beta hydrolase-fold protein [Flaviramulus basaltis]SFZ90880.1 Enterochelin esterase [Flaviramulus basaltis]
MKKVIFICFIFLLGCHASKINENLESKVLKKSFFSKELNKSVNYEIYFPANYNNQKKNHIIYLLHGHGGSEDDWFSKKEGNTKILLDSLIQIKAIKPLIAVTLNAENSWYVDSKTNMESAYIKEFIPFIETNYNIKTNQETRLIAGNSAGGYGALGYSLKYPYLFKAAILLSPAAYYPSPPETSSSLKIDVFKTDGIFNDSVWQSYSYKKLIDSNKEITNYPTFYISTGDDDSYNIFTVIADLRAFFIEQNIKNEVLVINGGHDWDVWHKCFTNDLIRVFND